MRSDCYHYIHFYHLNEGAVAGGEKREGSVVLIVGSSHLRAFVGAERPYEKSCTLMCFDEEIVESLGVRSYSQLYLLDVEMAYFPLLQIRCSHMLLMEVLHLADDSRIFRCLYVSCQVT